MGSSVSALIYNQFSIGKKAHGVTILLSKLVEFIGRFVDITSERTVVLALTKNPLNLGLGWTKKLIEASVEFGLGWTRNSLNL